LPSPWAPLSRPKCAFSHARARVEMDLQQLRQPSLAELRLTALDN